MDKTNENTARTIGLTNKLLIWFLCVALIPLGIFGFISYLNTNKTLRKQCLDNLITIADSKVRGIEGYFQNLEEDIIVFARNPIVISAVNQCEHYDMDISKNSEEYDTRINKLSSFLHYYSGKYGKTYDVFLLNSQGDIFFTIKKEDDYGTNILTGPYKDTQLAHVFKQATLLSEPYISSFEYYTPSKRISAFMGMPIWGEGKVIGVVCVQIDAQGIKELSGDYSGLGKTGEIVFGVKKGNYVSILAPLRHDPEAAFKKTITLGSKEAKPIQMAAQAREGIGHSVDYRGKDIIAVWRYLHYPGWGLEVKMDASEVFIPAIWYSIWVSILGIVTFVLVVIASVFISRSISNPIIKLTDLTKAIALGDLSYKKLEVKSGDEIGTLTKSFNTMAENLQKRTEELSRSNKELDDFAYTASHDLKEPLRGIHNYSSFLIEDYEDKLDEDGKHKLLTLMKLSKHLEALINNLLYYSRVGRTQEAFAETDLNHIVEEVKETLGIRIEEQGIDMRIPVSLPTVYCDKTRIKDIFSNLVTNSIKYNDKEEKWIEIGYTKDKHKIGYTFYVRDNGIGIEEEYTESIFGIFKRLHERDEYGGGTGAGLAIVKKIVEFHGGKIWVESTPGQGATFYFTLGA